MATFVYYPRLDQKQAQYVYDGIRQWFKDNPERDYCQCENFRVRRDHVKEDILAQCETGVKIKEEIVNKDFTKSLPKKPKAVKKVAKKTAPKATTKKTAVKKSTKKVVKKTK